MKFMGRFGIRLGKLKPNMQTEKINLVLLVLIAMGVAYISFYQPHQQGKKMKLCTDTAVQFEKMRHAPVDNSTVTNQAISSFQKNFLACMAD